MTTFKTAKSIMGDNCVAWYECGLQQEVRVTIPWSENVLRGCAKTHILVFGRAISLFDLHWEQHCKMQDEADRDYLGYREDYSRLEEEFTFKQRKEKLQEQWYLVRKNPTPRSMGLPFDAQYRLLHPRERLVTAVEAVFCYRAYAMARGEHLLKGVMARCWDCVNRTPWECDRDIYHRKVAGKFQPDGCFEEYLETVDDAHGVENVGIIACWKYPDEE